MAIALQDGRLHFEERTALCGDLGHFQVGRLAVAAVSGVFAWMMMVINHS